jgi:hypothetical protein
MGGSRRAQRGDMRREPLPTHKPALDLTLELDGVDHAAVDPGRGTKEDHAVVSIELRD